MCFSAGRNSDVLQVDAKRKLVDGFAWLEKPSISGSFLSSFKLTKTSLKAFKCAGLTYITNGLAQKSVQCESNPRGFICQKGEEKIVFNQRHGRFM